MTRQVVNQANRAARQVGEMSKAKRTLARPLLQQMATMAERTKQVIRQTKARIFKGNTKVPDKVVSMFEPHTEVIRKGKASKPTEFGKMVKIQEAENQVIVDYEVYTEKPNDSDLLVESVQIHEELLDRVPDLVAADAAFYSAANEKALEEKGVKRVAVPNRRTTSAARRKMQKVVQEWAALAYRVRRADQRTETTARAEPLALPRSGWHRKVGWPRCHRRQSDLTRTVDFDAEGGRVMTMGVGSVMAASWTRQTRFAFFDFRASIIFTCLESPFSRINALALNPQAKPGSLEQPNSALEAGWIEIS